MKRFKLTLLIIAMCLLGSKTQAMDVKLDGSTLTITLDKGEYLYQQVEKKDVLQEYYDKATKVVVMTKTSKAEDEETISNLTYLVPNDFAELNKFTKATTMDLHSVNYLFSDISLKGLSLKYVRLRDNIKNIQASWFQDAPAFEGAYSYSKEGNGNAYCVYCNSLSEKGGKIADIFNNLKGQFSIPENDPHFLNPDNDHLYVLVNGKINSSDVTVLTGSGLNYASVDMSLLNASYVKEDGTTDYANFSLSNANGKLKSIALPSDMDVIGDRCLYTCSSLTKVIIPDGVTSIGESAFDQCKGITSINIPEGCKTIKSRAFAQTCLQAIKLPSTLETIGNDAFTDNKYIASITFPKPATGTTLKIGDNAFLNCYNLRDIYITDKAPTINNGTFTNTQLGQNPNGNNLKDGEVTIDNYRTKGQEQDNPIFLHYPEGKGSEYGDNEGADNRASQYHLTGKDGVKYPKEVNGDKGNGEANKWYEHHSGWAQFVFAAPNTETPIPVPEQYNADRWYTMCFPFNLTRKQIEDTFGSGTEVCNFQYVEKEQIGEVTVYSIRFNEDLIKNGLEADGKTPITPGSKIITKANLPYMIHPSQKPDNGIYQITDGDRTEYEEKDGESVKTNHLISFKVTDKTAGSFERKADESTSSVNAVFQGNYEENKLIPYGVFFLGGNEYYKIEAAKEEGRTTGKLKKFTAYVKITDADFNADKYISDLKYYSQSNQAKIVFPSLWGEDEMSSTTTAILPIHIANKPADMENARIYNLQGQLVGTGAEALKSLRRGIYIMNGKKYVVR
jgi:hypothetical protein